MKLRSEIDRALEAAGFRMHEITEADNFEETLGLEIGGKRALLRPSNARVWRLYQALEHVLSLDRISSKHLQVLLGHLTFSWCISRSLLCITCACHQFVNQNII